MDQNWNRSYPANLRGFAAQQEAAYASSGCSPFTFLQYDLECFFQMTSYCNWRRATHCLLEETSEELDTRTNQKANFKWKPN